jgi:hypothetical protein
MTLQQARADVGQRYAPPVQRRGRDAFLLAGPQTRRFSI